MQFLIPFALFLSVSVFAQALQKKAIVYGGPGACTDGCVEGAVEAVRVAGLVPVVVEPRTWNPELLKDASVWVQPGGKAKSQASAMGSKMMNDVKNFVANGGGYVGFCAGAFIATYKIGTSFTKGLNLVPGKTILYKAKGYPTIEKMDWLTSNGKEDREIYWEGGPYFSFQSPRMEVMAHYSRTKQPSAVRVTHGKGRVYVTGAHPEAPQWWRDDSSLDDKDGLDYDITSEMISWAAR